MNAYGITKGEPQKSLFISTCNGNVKEKIDMNHIHIYRKNPLKLAHLEVEKIFQENKLNEILEEKFNNDEKTKKLKIK